MVEEKKIVEFIRENHRIVAEYYQKWYKAKTLHCKTPYQKLRILFLSAIEATNRGKLDDKHDTVREFLRKIEKFKTKDKISFNEFCEAITGNPNCKIEELWSKLKMKQFKEKRAALFLRDAIEIGNKDIFGDEFDYQNYYPRLKIPIDIVIKLVCKQIWHKEMKNDEIREKAEYLFDEKYMLIEDFWFWGHFGAVRKDKKVEFKLNKAMVGLDELIDEEFLNKHKLEEKINEFVSLIS